MLGHNRFFQSGCGLTIRIIGDQSLGRRFYFTDSVRYSSIWFNPNVRISIKEVRLYTFERNNPFTKIKNTILTWRNETYRAPSHRYYIEVRIFMFNINLCAA